MAKENEELGFDVQYFGDNPCTRSDPFSELRAAAEATTTIRLGTGVTNLVIRHPATVASSMAAVQVCSGGRAICGVGRGDSAVGMVGLRPQRNAEFADQLGMLKIYLDGGTQRIAGWDSRLVWLSDFDYQRVPLEVMASGPKSLAIAATVCDRISLAVGAAPERIRWALDIVNQGLEAAGRQRSDVQIGAFVQVLIDDNRVKAIDELRTRVHGWAHMASFPGHDLDTQPEIMREATEKLRTGYNYANHSQEPDNPQAALISPELADWFGIGGPTSFVVERLGQLAELGLDYFNFASLPFEEREQIAGSVIPQLRHLV